MSCEESVHSHLKMAAKSQDSAYAKAFSARVVTWSLQLMGPEVGNPYIYICIYIQKYIYICLYIYIYLFIYLYIYIYIFI